MSTRPTVGFIGLGLMGTGFVKRLIATGHKVVGYDIVPDKVAAAVALGAEAGRSPADVAARADIVCVCVMTAADLAAVVEAEGGITSAGRLDGKVLVDHSTTLIDVTRRLAALLADKTGMGWVDAPVSGGPGAAEAGTLAIMAGGSDGDVARVSPAMEKLGSFTHMGPLTAGQATKMVNQVLVLNNYVVIAEALRLAEAYGVDAAKVPTALASGFAGSNLLPVMMERMIARDWTPKGYAFQVLKDLEMVNDAAKAEHLAMPMLSQALTLFRMLYAQGKGSLDGAAVLDLLPEPGKK
ncbi:MAG: NAD(P)-dependent oxidoreductase [Hyphomicrobiaceae bacterium]